jgi:DNA-binding MarR family transcriptional regulator
MPTRRSPTAPPATVDALTQLAFVLTGALERRAAEHDHSLIQTRLLGALRDRQPSMQTLARWLNLDKSSLTGLVDRAERRGLVARTPSPTDRRAVLVSLTPAGRALAAHVGAQYEADVAHLLTPLSTAERKTLTALATRLLAAHAAEQGIDLSATRE